MEDHETLQTLRARYAEIAEQVLNGQMSAKKAAKANRALDKKLDRFTKALKEAEAAQQAAWVRDWKASHVTWPC
jgi:hypothetical protein